MLAISQPGNNERNYRLKENIDLPFVHIGFRKGGPIENTAATRMYWNDDTRNSTVFSKLFDSNPLPCDGGGGG